MSGRYPGNCCPCSHGELLPGQEEHRERLLFKYDLAQKIFVSHDYRRAQEIVLTMQSVNLLSAIEMS